MTLQEFFSDQSFGGSWADDDIDMASISVPIENYKHSQSKDPFRSSHPSGGFGGHSFYNRLSGMQDNGPPYIVKLLNLPITCNDSFIEDLFRSRYTTFVKFKIVVDPSSNILETHVIKKVAFVELESFQEMNKVLKWQDLYYKGTRRVVIELADFHDFQTCISFNQEHEREIQQIQEEFIKQKHNQSFGHGGFEHGGSRNLNVNSPTRGHQPLNHASSPLQPSLSDRKSTILPEGSTAPPPTATPPKNKPNPFGLAKPVDVLSKQHEIDKKLIAINHTTIKTLGPMADGDDSAGDHNTSESHHVPRERRSLQKDSRRSSVNILKRSPHASTNQNVDDSELHPDPEEAEKAELTSAPIPESIYAPKDSNKSLAELLSKNDNRTPSKGRSTPKSIKNSPKPSVPKPVILKKKASAPATDLTVKEDEYIQITKDASNDNEASDKTKDEVTGHNVKQINDSLFKTDELLNSINKSHANGSSILNAPTLDSPQDEKKDTTSTKFAPTQEAERAIDRPNFKKHFAELNKRQFVQREKPQQSQNTRLNVHSQNYSKKNNSLNHRLNSCERGGSKAMFNNNQRSAESSNEISGTTSDENIIKDDRTLLGQKVPGRSKNRYTGKNKLADFPKKDIRKIDEVKTRRLQANPKDINANKSGKKIKETRSSEKPNDPNGVKNARDLKDEKFEKNVKEKGVKNIKDVRNVKQVKDVSVKDRKGMKYMKDSNDDTEASTKLLNQTIEDIEKHKEISMTDITIESANDSTSYPTGGKLNGAESISRSIRGKGRGRDRDNSRGSTRGSRGNRGRGNYNLHYVRSKDHGNSEI